ncbi:hypothetical protein D3C86_1288020 [compost metagenome]
MKLLGADSNAGIRNGDTQAHSGIRAQQLLDADHDLAFHGEFEGIARQVDQHLLQPQAIAYQVVGQIGVQVKQDLDLFLPLVAGQHNGEVTHEQFEFEWVHIELQFAGLNLGVVEDVIEQTQQ